MTVEIGVVLGGFLLGIPLLALSGRMKAGTLLRLERGSAWLCFAPLVLAGFALCFLRYTPGYAALLLLLLLGSLFLAQTDRENRGRYLRHRVAFWLILSLVLSEGVVALSAAGRGGETVRKFGYWMAEDRAVPEATRLRARAYAERRFARFNTEARYIGTNLEAVKPVPYAASLTQSRVRSGAGASSELASMGSLLRSPQAPKVLPRPSNSAHSPVSLAESQEEPRALGIEEESGTGSETRPIPSTRSLTSGGTEEIVEWKDQSIKKPTTIEAREFTPIDVMSGGKTPEPGNLGAPGVQKSHLDITQPLEPRPRKR